MILMYYIHPMSQENCSAAICIHTSWAKLKMSQQEICAFSCRVLVMKPAGIGPKDVNPRVGQTWMVEWSIYNNIWSHWCHASWTIVVLYTLRCQ